LNDTVRTLRDDALANASYLIGVGGGRAVTIDPPRDIDAHLALADRLGVEVVGHVWAEMR
jgi:hypothetical protein